MDRSPLAALDPSRPAAEAPTVLDRRNFLRLGGLSLGAAVVLTGCATSGGTADGEGAVATTTTTEPSPQDGVRLRTASSIEQFLISAYRGALDAGTLSEAATEVATAFLAHHEAHATVIEGEVKKLGFETVDGANGELLSRYQQRIATARAEADVLRIAVELEHTAAATYQAFAGSFQGIELNRTMMSIGGVEARHATYLAAMVAVPPLPPTAFHSTQGAISAGAGL